MDSFLFCISSYKLIKFFIFAFSKAIKTINHKSYEIL